MAGNGYQGNRLLLARSASLLGTGFGHGKWPAQSIGHVFQEPGLAASRRSLEEHRYFLGIGNLKQLYLILDWQVEWFLFNYVLLHQVFPVRGLMHLS